MRDPMLSLVLAGLAASSGLAQERLPVVSGVEQQPLVAATRRLVETLDFLGAPLKPADRASLEAAWKSTGAGVAARIQAVLDANCLAFVHINPESRVKVRQGPGEAKLVQHGWRAMLVKIHNEAAVTSPLRVRSPNAGPVFKRSTGSPAPRQAVSDADVRDRFLGLGVYTKPPLKRALSGFALEYRIVNLYSRDAGQREAKLLFDVGQGTQDIGFRSAVSILFECLPAVAVELDVRDHDGKPCMASFVFKDVHGRVYPAPARRLAPDFFFHHQVYRKTGETVLLPPGAFTVEYGRGPEYVVKRREIVVPAREKHSERFDLERWIDTAARGWWSGDHHIHAAGCSHYESPTEGVRPEHMMRHILGEDLKVGCVLSWGPCWYHQKQFFDGKAVHELSTPKYLMRYDVEVSGFPSSHAGHLSLIRLTEDDYPGTTKIHEWPSWDLPILQWAKKQGAVVGFSHSGFGLQVPGRQLPNYRVPRFDGIGANEFIVDVAHDAVHFISAVDTPATWELNIWYHTLNCGYRARISGETDFPCIYGERVGLGRSYVRIPEPKGLSYDEWAYGVRDGRCYVSDGKSHLMDLRVGGVRVGEPGTGGRISELALDGPGSVPVRCLVAARLGARPRPDLQARPLARKPYWDLERARIGTTTKVPVELVVNGKAVARKDIVADGKVVELTFDARLEHSSWVALRIFPSSHTNPVFVQVGGKPIRASRRSAEWCMAAVEQCWKSKRPRIRPAERKAARAAYDFAAERYRAIRDEAVDDR